MKNIIGICIGLALVLLLCLYLPKESVQSDSTDDETISIQSKYTIGEYEGQVAVFSPDSNIPVKVFDTYVSSLPQEDREKIRDGISVETPDELQRLIEDFTG